ncbi:hypothetical protein GCM10027346_27770 [Hymenobacter seoulensis]
MKLGNYLGLVENSEKQLAEAFEKVANHHKDEPDIEQMCRKLSAWSVRHKGHMQPFLVRYSADESPEPNQMEKVLFSQPRNGSLALLRDLHDLWLLANEVELCWDIIGNAALALRDKELEAACSEFQAETKRQVAWLLARIKQAAPQALVVA